MRLRHMLPAAHLDIHNLLIITYCIIPAMQRTPPGSHLEHKKWLAIIAEEEG